MSLCDLLVLVLNENHVDIEIEITKLPILKSPPIIEIDNFDLIQVYNLKPTFITCHCPWWQRAAPKGHNFKAKKIDHTTSKTSAKWVSSSRVQVLLLCFLYTGIKWESAASWQESLKCLSSFFIFLSILPPCFMHSSCSCYENNGKEGKSSLCSSPFFSRQWTYQIAVKTAA